MQNSSEHQSNIQQVQNYSHKYSIISYKTRKALIEMVEENGFSIYKSASLLNIKQSTAKAIMRRYRRKGHIFIRKNQRPFIEMLHQQEKQSKKQHKIKLTKAPKEKIGILASIDPVHEVQAQAAQVNLLVPQNLYNYYWNMPQLWMMPNYFSM